MFGKLKDKLKSALSIFSKKAEEEAEVKVVETISEVIPEVKPKEVIRKEEEKVEEKKTEKKKEKSTKIPEKKEIVEKGPEIKITPEKKEIPRKNTISIIINSPVAQVFQFTTNPQKTPLWIEHITFEETNEWPVKLGTQYKNVNKEGEWATYEVVEFQRNTLFQLKQKNDFYSVRYDYTVLSSNKTKLIYSEWVEEGVLTRPFTISILEKLKRIIEQGGGEGKENTLEKKETVLILHGWEDNAKSGFIPHLQNFLHQKNMEVLAFDQPNTAKPNFEEWFSFAEKKIKESKSNSLSIVGHSMGGLLALKLAEKYKLKKLILVAPVGSSPSENYFKEIGKKISPEELQIFRKYQTRPLDIRKIKSNVEEIALVFGLQDEWITDEIRNFYVDSFQDVAEIHLLEEFGHMSESEGVKHLPILEELFSRKIRTGIIEHKKVAEEKKGFFSKIKETFRKREEAPPTVIEEKRVIVEEKQVEISEKIVEPAEPEKGFFGKIKQAITTKTISAEKFEELFWDLEVVLLENNVSVEVIERIKKDLGKELIDRPLPRDVEGKILETLKKTLLDILTFKDINLIEKSQHQKPLVIAFFGINGTGKTTSIAKLTKYFQLHHKSVVLAACDTFRAAAIQQLEEHANALGVKIIKQDYGSDAAAVAFDAVKYAQKNNIDIVLIDTAGRLHSNTNLMAELDKIIRVAKPDVKIFVGESITGNDCIEQARQFNQLVEMDGVILTKADVDEKGGAPLSIAYTIKKPILFLGVGQRYEDLEKFDPVKMVQQLGL